jgi:hypothetical protein
LGERLENSGAHPFLLYEFRKKFNEGSSLRQIEAFLKYIAQDGGCKEKVSSVKNLEELATIASAYGFELDIELLKTDSIHVKSEMNRVL